MPKCLFLSAFLCEHEFKMVSLTHKRYWIFDLDGTLTKPVHDFAHIRNELGLAPNTDILSAIALQPEEKRRTMLAHLDELERYYAAQAQPAEGAVELLTKLDKKDCCLGILTRNAHEFALLSLQAIGAADFFATQDILGRDEAKPKPSPEGINILLNQWVGDSKKAVMVGDFHFDLLSGRAASVTTVHVDMANRHWPEETDIRVNSLFELLSQFDE